MRDVVVRWAPVRPDRGAGLLRAVVAEVCGVVADEVRLAHRCVGCGSTDHGRPWVAVHGRPGPEVSLARTEELAIVAVAGRPVGIDAEPLRASGPTGGDVHEWVRLEAALKATGLGLSVDPSLVDLAHDRIERWDGPGRRPALRIATVSAVPGHAAAVARLGRRPIRLG